MCIGEAAASSLAIETAIEDATTVDDDSASGPPSDPSATQSLHPGGNPDGDPGRLEPGTIVRYFGDYELMSVLGRGGMGIVYKARQVSLNRLVALKMLQAGTLATEDDLRRFQNEAEAVAMLDHPQIVPIFEVGQHDGRRYFSMKLIGGSSLDRKSGDYTHDPRAAARLVGTLAEAVHHAHQRGILHRDLKPGNVLLDEHGEPHVTDFGLAKRVRRDIELTQSGAILGTPAYMAPEQTSGKRGMVTTATDVHGLGAVLYTLLTGQAPFGGDSPAETFELVRERTPEPPSKRNPRVPRDLEIIALKCLEKEPGQRYSSAAALADDLRRYLNGQSILARPVWLRTRAWMWCKRNPVLAGLASALLLVMLIGSLGVIIVEQGRRRESEARALAVTNKNLAKKALDDYFTRVSEDTLLNEQNSVDLRRLRGELLETALGFYREFLRDRGSDPELRREQAEAQFRVGRIMRDIGSSDQTIAAFRASIDIWEELLAAAPSDREVRAQLARSYLALGDQFAHIPDFPHAHNALAKSREILQRLAQEDPSESSYSLTLAECDKELGIAEAQGGEPDRGLERLREAEAILKSLLERAPGDPGYRKRLADTIITQGFIYERTGKYADALWRFRESQGYFRSLLDEHRSGPKSIDLLDSLALSYYNIGTILNRLEVNDTPKWMAMFEKSLEYRQMLANPSVNEVRAKLARELAEIADLRHKAGRHAEAFSAIRGAIEIFESLVASEPDQPQYHAMLGRAYWILGFLHDEDRDNARALPALLRSRDEEDRAVADSPKSEQYRLNLAGILWNLGEQYVDLGRVADGLPHYRRSVEIKQQLLAARPNDRGRILDLAVQLAMRAAVERHGGDSAAARRSYGESAALLEPIDPRAGDSDLQVARAGFLMAEAVSAADQGPIDQALPLLQKAMEILTPLVASVGDDPRPRRRLTEALWERSRLLRSAGDSTSAERLDAEREALWNDRPPRELADLAMEETTEAARVGYGRLPVNAGGTNVRRLYLDLASCNLLQAISRGFRDLAWLRRNADAHLLLSRDEIKNVILDLDFPALPFAEER